MMKILGVKVQVEGEVQNQPGLVISNHRSFSDPLILLHYVDAFPLAKAEVDTYPLIGFGARITGVLYVTRESISSRKGAREEIKTTLKRGQNVLVYPEGTTSNAPGTLPFKKGSFEVANQLGLPILPVCIEYEDPDHHWVERSLWQQYVLQFGNRNCICRLVFGQPISSQGETYGSDVTRAWIESEIEKFRKQRDQEPA